jgi:hypothetical protein
MSKWQRINLTFLILLVVGLAPAGAALAQIKVTAATPASAVQGTISLDVVVSGAGFDNTAKVQYFVSGTTNPGGITVKKVAFRNSKELVTTIDVADTADLASFDIQVTLSSGRKGKGTTLFTVTSKLNSIDSYVGQNLGTLPGDSGSDAWDVNAAGNVVGRSYSSTMKAFYWAGAMSRLPVSAAALATPPYTVAWDAEANAISDGPAEIAVGYERRQICETQNGPCSLETYPVFWAGDLRQSPAAIRLDVAHCMARGINPAGSMAVGACSGQAGATWRREGSSWFRTNIPLGAFPCGGCVYDSGAAEDANDAGIIIGSVSRKDNYLQFAYVYNTQSSMGAILPIPPGFVQSGASAVGNIRDGVVHVSGVAVSCSDWGCAGDRAIRWTVDVNSLQTSFEILDQLAWAEGVTDGGVVAGTHNSGPNRRGAITQTAMLWRELSGYVSLKPPTGSDSTTRGMAAESGGSVFVVGVSNSKGAWTAARWVIP